MNCSIGMFACVAFKIIKTFIKPNGPLITWILPITISPTTKFYTRIISYCKARKVISPSTMRIKWVIKIISRFTFLGVPTSPIFMFISFKFWLWTYIWTIAFIIIFTWIPRAIAICSRRFIMIFISTFQSSCTSIRNKNIANFIKYFFERFFCNWNYLQFFRVLSNFLRRIWEVIFFCAINIIFTKWCLCIRIGNNKWSNFF